MAFEVVVVAVVAAIKPRKAFIFGSQSIMSSSPAAIFHQPACQAHSGQCEAKHSPGCESMCVKGFVVVVSALPFHPAWRLGKPCNVCFSNDLMMRRKKIIEWLLLICGERKQTSFAKRPLTKC